jgi:multicomponent K+:H+ antiporter subunit A
LFLCAGAVQHATGTRDLRRLGGLAARMPHTARIWLIAAAAIVGVPLTNGFVAKWLLLDAALEANQAIVVLVAWVVSVFTAFYMLKATVSTFYGEMPAWLETREVRDPDPTMLTGMGFLAGLCVLFGLAPQILMQGLVAPAVRGLGFQWQVTLSWLGLQTTSAGVQVTLGAVIALVALLAGWLVFRLTRSARVAPRPVGLFTGGDPLPAAVGVSVVDFAAVAETAFTPVYEIADPDRLYLALWQGIKSLAGQVERLAHTAGDEHPLVVTLVLAALVFVAVWLW